MSQTEAINRAAEYNALRQFGCANWLAVFVNGKWQVVTAFNPIARA